MLKNHWGKLTVVLLVVVFGGAFWFANQAAEKANEGIVLAENVKGNPDSAVEIVKYSDFQCPACAQAATVLDDVVASYGSDLHVEYRHFPLISIHPLAIPAARASEAAAQQGQFWAMHDLLFENQRAWSTAPNPTAIFIGYAEQLGLDVAEFRRHMGASRINTHVEEQFAEAREQGFTGTPTILLNGERMVFETYEDFVAQIEAALGVTAEEANDESEPTAADLGIEVGI